MAEESLRAAIKTIRTRLQAELDNQLGDPATQQSTAAEASRRVRDMLTSRPAAVVGFSAVQYE
jgi:hypothetical protein